MFKAKLILSVLTIIDFVILILTIAIGSYKGADGKPHATSLGITLIIIFFFLSMILIFSWIGVLDEEEERKFNKDVYDGENEKK